MRQVFIENARFEPSPPDPEQPSVFHAEVQSYFFEDPQIKWTLRIENDEQGTTVRTFEQADWLDFDESFLLQVPWDRTDDQGQPSTGNHRATLRVWVQEKTLTNPNGSHPVVLAEETIDYFVPGTKTLELDYLFSEPPSLESGQVGPVTLIPYAIIQGFPTPPEVSWSITIEVPGLGDQIFQGANNLDFVEASWEAAGAGGAAVPDGIYTVQVRAEIASEGLVAEKSFPYS
ncbi:hypothetical protein DYH09_34465, partial [bacterium CPR1]|nr:hypothetical protein [bacterium CPR1]